MSSAIMRLLSDKLSNVSVTVVNVGYFKLLA